MNKMPSLWLSAALGVSLALFACGPTGFDGGNGVAGDADGDGISDADENRDAEFDTDQDGTPDYLDDDSDGDCIPDSIEAGDSDPNTPPRDSDGDGIPDFRDLDSDGDGLGDAQEDLDCNGEQNDGETSHLLADTDGDGASDLVENAAKTDPLDPLSNPAANGDFVFVVPYQNAPQPAEDDLNFSTELQMVDLYVLVDRSGSMKDEISSIRNNMQTVISNLTCPPLGTGTPGQCIRDIWSGLGTFTYAGRDPFVNRVDVQPNPSAIGSNMPGSDTGSCPNGGCVEPHLLAAFSVASGQGPSATGCFGVSSYSDRFDCAGSPAGNTGVGYPCFRADALPVILLATDEPPSTQFSCPGFQTTSQAAAAIGARIVGIRGSSETSSEAAKVETDLKTLASSTGAVDSSGSPLVFPGANSGAAAAIETGIRTLSNSLPLDIAGVAVDDTADDVDAVAAFVDRLETLQIDTPECSTGLGQQDSNSDGYPDVFTGVIAGTPVCWKLVPKINETVQGAAEPVLYRAEVQVYGDRVTLLDTRNVFFVVPPDLGQVL